MPIYEFHCRACNTRFETLVFGSEPIECPECDGADLEKLLSVPAPPKAQAGLPMTCDPNAPACGPGCRKLTE